MTSEYELAKEHLNKLSPSDLDEIEQLSVGLSESECLLYFGFKNIKDLGDKSNPQNKDKQMFTRAFNRGRLRGKNNAVIKLFESMGSRQGAAASLSYLKRFADLWHDDSDIDDNEGGKSISFKVIMD
ncbi:MAG: hypothetical protein V3R78_12600 [Thermodesulfobacteriota bacterium]